MERIRIAAPTALRLVAIYDHGTALRATVITVRDRSQSRIGATGTGHGPGDRRVDMPTLASVPTWSGRSQREPTRGRIQLLWKGKRPVADPFDVMPTYRGTPQPRLSGSPVAAPARCRRASSSARADRLAAWPCSPERAPAPASRSRVHSPNRSFSASIEPATPPQPCDLTAPASLAHEHRDGRPGPQHQPEQGQHDARREQPRAGPQSGHPLTIRGGIRPWNARPPIGPIVSASSATLPSTA